MTLLVVREQHILAWAKRNLLVHAGENSGGPVLIAVSRGWIDVIMTL